MKPTKFARFSAPELDGFDRAGAGEALQLAGRPARADAAEPGPVDLSPVVTDVVRISAEIGGGQAPGITGGFSVSADGTKVVFEYSDTAAALPNQIRITDLTTGVTTMVVGFPAGTDCYNPAFSPDGTRIAYQYDPPGGTTNKIYLVIRDLASGTETIVSTLTDGTLLDGISSEPAFSPDGSKLVFESVSANLPGGTARTNIGIKDLSTGTFTLVTTDSSGNTLNGNSGHASFSPDGTKLLFDSAASNLLFPDPNSASDVYVRDLATGTVTRLVQGHFASYSPDGTKLLFISDSAILVAGDTNADDDIFIMDLATSAITLVSRTAAGVQPNEDVETAHFSPDGTKVVFTTFAGNLVAGDGFNNDVFVKDLVTGEVVLVSRNPATGGATGGALFDAIFSPDGTGIFFTSTATNLVAGDTNGRADLFFATLADAVDQVVIGTSGNDTLAGGPGDDYIDGLAGADAMAGGAGNDTYVIDNPGDTITEEAGVDGGTGDRLYALVNYALNAGAAVEILAAGDAASTSALDLTGNEFDNNIWGSAGANVLTGGDGNDTLFGFGGDDHLLGNGGNDWLIGGAGADAMEGGAGDDLYLFEDAGDTVTELTGEGFDRINTTLSYALATGNSIEILAAADAAGTAAIDLRGNELNNNIWGNDGANLLLGRAGSDSLAGRGGDDVLSGGDDADVMAGGTGNDILLGGGGNDQMRGDEGADYLDGGAGADMMAGGDHDDIYVVDNAGDSVAESSNSGNDRVYASLSWTLAPTAQVEVVAAGDAAGTQAIDFTGNSFNNSLWGNEGANRLDGGGGADFLFGFGGDDILLGGAGSDLLVGGAGNDAMTGGDGSDLYLVEDLLDTVAEAGGIAGGTADRVNVTLSWTLAAGVEVEILSAADSAGTGAIDLTGNDLANNLWGNAGVNSLSGAGGNDNISGLGGADTLNGGDGNDLLDGGADSDMLTGGIGADSFAFVNALGAGNIDTITDFAAGTDKVALAVAIFTGLPIGTLAAGAFNTGSTASQADDRILYDSATGALYFDADGNATGFAAIQFATVQTGLSLSASDFQVI